MNDWDSTIKSYPFSLLDDGKTWELKISATDNDGWFKIAPDFAYEKPLIFFDNLLCAPYDGCEELSGKMKFGNLGAWHLPQSDVFHSYTISIVPTEMTFEIVPNTIEKPNKTQIWQDPKTKVNYEYTVGESSACVKEGTSISAGSPEVTGDVTILSNFTVDGNEYTVTKIEDYAFYGCSGLVSATIPESVIGIGENAFIGTAWYNEQPYGIVYLDNWALGYNSFTIQGSAFIKKGTKGIADGAFCYTDIINVIMPESMAIIGEKAFEGCNKLEKVYCYSKSVPNTSIDAFSNSSQQEAILYVPTAFLNDYKNSIPWSEFSIIKGIEGKDNLKPGDVNGDIAIDVADIASVIDYMAGNESVNKAAADVNQDNRVDVADIASLIDIMAAGDTRYEYCTFEEDGMEGILTESGLYALLQYTLDGTGCIFTNGNIHDDSYSCLLIDSLGFVKGVKTSDNRTFIVMYTPNELWLIDSEGNIVTEIPYSEFEDKKDTPYANSRGIRKAWGWTRSPLYQALSVGNRIKGYIKDATIQAGLDLLDYISSGYGTRYHELFSKMVSLGFGWNDPFAWIETLEKLEEVFYFGNASITALDAIPWERNPCCFITPCKVEGLSTNTSAFTNIHSRYEEMLNFSFDLKMTAQTSAIPHTERKFLTAYNIPSNGTYDDFVFDFNELQTKYDYEPSLTLNMTIKRLSSEYDGAMIYYYNPLGTSKYDIIQRSCTIYGKPNSLVTGSVSSLVEKVENPKTTSADIICSFSDVPDGAKCLVKVNIKGSDLSFLYYGKPGVKSQTVKATNLQMNTAYVASTYISYNGREYNGIGSVEFSTSGPSGDVISVDEASITRTSAVANCKFTGVESGMECGVIAKSSKESLTFPASATEGEQQVSMTGLTPSTQYECYAYVKGPRFYKERGGVSFTTKPASLACTWNCTVTMSNGDTVSLTISLKEDGKGSATRAGSNREYEAGGSVGADGQASVSVSYTSSVGLGGLSYETYNFWGKVDNLLSPSSIRGSGTHAIGNAIAESSYDFTFVMSK